MGRGQPNPYAMPVAAPPQGHAAKSPSVADASVQAMVNADVPIVRHQLAVAQSILDPCFKSLSQGGDARGYHGLGPVSLADEAEVMEKLADIGDTLSNFARWCQIEGAPTGARYLQHCREAADRISRLQDKKQALASSRRLLERHLPLSSRRKFLEILEGIAREACVPFFSLEDASKPTPASDPTHCMSGQTFVLDFHVEAGGKVAWAKLQRLLTSGDVVPSDAEAGEQQWCDLNATLAHAMQATDLELVLRDKFAALHLIEDSHAKYPQARVYDTLYSLEKAVSALHNQQQDAAVAASVAAGRTQDVASAEVTQDRLFGLGVMTRLVEGLEFEFYQSLGGWGEVKTCKALLHVVGVVPRNVAADAGVAGAAAATPLGAPLPSSMSASVDGPDGAKGNHRVVMNLRLSSPVIVSLSTASSLQALDVAASQHSCASSSSRVWLVARNESGMGTLDKGTSSWHTLALEPAVPGTAGLAMDVSRDGVSRTRLRRRCVVVRGRMFDMVDDSPEVLGVAVVKVPVANAEHVQAAIQMFRQQLVMTELYASCFGADQDDAETAMEVDGAKVEKGLDTATDSAGATGGGQDDRAGIALADGAGGVLVEVTAMPPSRLFVHMLPPASPQGEGGFELTCLEIEVALGGEIAATLHMPKGHVAPCGDGYASAVLRKCRNIPMALTYMFPP